jgi:hypothetical protein
MKNGLRLAAAMLTMAGCRGGRVEPVSPSPLSPASSQILPTRYDNDRFFAVPTTASGSVATLLLDTGDNSRVWETFVARFKLGVDSSPGAKPTRMTSLPPLRAGLSVPSPSLNRGQIRVTPPQDMFDTLMSRRTDGQLGYDWFTDRIWTLDYPGRRILLHATTPPRVDGEHETPLGFVVDSAGHRIGVVPRIAIVVDGDSLNMLFDTGATIWMPDAARAAVGGNEGSERAVSLIWQSIFDRWRQRHPEWPVVADGDEVSHAPLIRVPSVRIAGFDTGPVWFRSLVGAKMAPPPRNPKVPLVRAPFVGTVGGNVFQNFVIVLDYPAAVARFRTAN